MAHHHLPGPTRVSGAVIKALEQEKKQARIEGESIPQKCVGCWWGKNEGGGFICLWPTCMRGKV